ncbi:hypothetical protein ACOMHN_065064 [Nucella lapillus]
MTSPRRLGLMMARRSYGALGCVWLVVIPALLFLLFQLYQTQLKKPHHPGSPLRLPSSQDFLISRVHFKDAKHFKDTDISQVLTSGSDSSSSRLKGLERKVNEDYAYTRLALFASSGNYLHSAQETLSLDGGVEALKNLRTFQPLLTPREKSHLLYLLEIFAQTCGTHDLTFFLLENSLLGSVRHHGLVPWRDVSVTVGMSKEQQKVVREVLEGVKGVVLMWPDPNRWSLRLQDTPPDPPTFSRMTYIAIQFYQQNRSHVWADSWNSRLFSAALSRVFPLALRPFEGHMMPVPCDVTSVLGGAPDVLRQCWVVVEDLHEAEFREAGLVSCDVLSRVFPFVTRRLAMTSRTTIEQVTVNGTLLSTAVVDGVCDAT